MHNCGDEVGRLRCLPHRNDCDDLEDSPRGNAGSVTEVLRTQEPPIGFWDRIVGVQHLAGRRILRGSEILERANRGGGRIIRAGPTNSASNTPQLDSEERDALHVFRVDPKASIGQLAFVDGLARLRWNLRAGGCRLSCTVESSFRRFITALVTHFASLRNIQLQPLARSACHAFTSKL
jgi:hypothetical protein